MNKQEAAAFLEVSTRAIERYTTQGKLNATYKQGKFGSEAVYSQAELEAFKAEREQPTDKPASSALVAPSRSVKGDDIKLLAVEIAEAFFNRAQDRSPLLLPGEPPQSHDGFAPLSINELLLLTLRQAAQLSGLSAGFLRKAITDKKLKASLGLGRGWKIKREDLDAFVKKL